tara:strand:+ start:1949 stop:2575 length:627 start_codon:yes stop_codon:yes gene_type:complete
MPTPKGTPSWWEDAKRHLRDVDSEIGRIIDCVEEPSLIGEGDIVRTICNAVVGQQISAIAADAIWKRLLDYCGGTFDPNPITKITEEDQKKIGISRSKGRTLAGIAEISEHLQDIEWSKMSSEEVVGELQPLWGIGPWTIDMVRIFSLLDPDVLPIGDIGVIRCIEAMEGRGPLEIKEIEQRAEIWKPFRTCAVWYLWRQHDESPVQY